MDLREKTPPSAKVHAIHHQIGVHIKARRRRSVSQAYSECLATLFSPMGVQQYVPRYPEDPCSRIFMDPWRLIEATPHDKKRVSNDVFGVVPAFSTALNKSEQVWVNRFVQQSKGLLPVRGTRKVTHNLYLSVT
jgi:hypothetical protein